MTLSQRAAQLAGPDRAVDAEVAVALGYRIVGEGHPLGTQCYDENGVSVPLPRFTGSLDAALTVVPEGWHFYLESEISHAAVESRIDGREFYADAATPALAVLSAALAARGL